MNDWPKIRRFGLMLLGAGMAWLGEHVITCGYTELWDFLGHEWYGLAAIIVGFFLVAVKKK